MDDRTADDAHVEQDQRAVGVDGERLGHFLKVLALGVLAAHANANLHEHALATAPRQGMGWFCGDPNHRNPRSIYLYLREFDGRGDARRVVFKEATTGCFTTCFIGEQISWLLLEMILTR